MTSYGDFDDARIKHLDLIQAAITRLAGNGFLMKGWALTLAGIFFGFAVESKEWRLALVSILPTVAFWGLDTYFLRSERLFRELYRRVATRDANIPPFFMDATGREFVEEFGGNMANFGERSLDARCFRGSTGLS